MIDEKIKLCDEIEKKKEELLALKHKLKTEFKTTYRNKKFKLVPMPETTQNELRNARNVYRTMTGQTNATYGDVMQLLLKLFNDYCVKLTNEKENENPISK